MVRSPLLQDVKKVEILAVNVSDHHDLQQDNSNVADGRRAALINTTQPATSRGLLSLA